MRSDLILDMTEIREREREREREKVSAICDEESNKDEVIFCVCFEFGKSAYDVSLNLESDGSVSSSNGHIVINIENFQKIKGKLTVISP